MTTEQRCAVHPARPAFDTCPVCARPRCAADADEAPGGGCVACRGSDRPVGRPRPQRRDILAAAVSCHLAALAGGAVASQYVDVTFFDVIVPAGIGIVCGAVAEAAARGTRGSELRVVAVLYAVVGAVAAVRFVPGPQSLVTPLAATWPGYAAAAAGAWLWTAPPRRRKPSA